MQRNTKPGLDDVLVKLLQPLYRLGQPHVEGLQHIDSARPALIVANHTTLGVLDVPFFYIALREKSGVRLRALAHKFGFKTPVTKAILQSMGAVEGTRENCNQLMEAGEHILVFPGGGREVSKTKGQKYQLLWQERMGFVKMAVEHGYPIIPLASVGAEECYDIRFDRTDLLKTPLGPWIKRIAVKLDHVIKFDEIPPLLVTGWGGTLLPRPERFYFKFMPPIETAHVSPDDELGCHQIKAATKIAIETGIIDLLSFRETDPLRNPLAARLRSLK
jgi:1-acyl-sn-glycerol-3-phosphate acyltransferase